MPARETTITVDSVVTLIPRTMRTATSLALRRVPVVACWMVLLAPD
jgi:hypothetical protein